MLCSNDSLLFFFKFLASFEGRKEILWMFQGFLEVRKTVSELTCEHLRVLNIFQPDNAHIYVSSYSCLVTYRWTSISRTCWDWINTSRYPWVWEIEVWILYHCYTNTVYLFMLEINLLHNGSYFNSWVENIFYTFVFA